MKFSKAQQLAEDPLNGCAVVRGQVRHVWLPPSQLGKIKSGVKEIIENTLGKYSERLDGIPLAFCNIQVIPRASVLLYDDVDMHLDVKYDVVMFRVTSGSLIKCKVNEVAADHLSCLVHGIINLAVPLPGLNFDLHDPRGLEVVCRVKEVQYKKGIISISGELTNESIQKLQDFYVEVKEDYAAPNPASESSESSKSSSGEESGDDFESGGGNRSPTSTVGRLATPTTDDLSTPARVTRRKEVQTGSGDSVVAGIGSLSAEGLSSPPVKVTKKKRKRDKKVSAPKELPVVAMETQHQGPKANARVGKDKMMAIGYREDGSPTKHFSDESDFEITPTKGKSRKLKKSRSKHPAEVSARIGALGMTTGVDDTSSISAEKHLGGSLGLEVDPLQLPHAENEPPGSPSRGSAGFPSSGVLADFTVEQTRHGDSADGVSGKVTGTNKVHKKKKKKEKKKELSLMEPDDHFFGGTPSPLGQQERVAHGGVADGPLDMESADKSRKKEKKTRKRKDRSGGAGDRLMGSPDRYGAGDRRDRGPVTSTAKKRRLGKGSGTLAGASSPTWEDAIASSSQEFADVFESAYTSVRRKDGGKKKSKRDRPPVHESGQQRDGASGEGRTKKHSKHLSRGDHTFGASPHEEELQSFTGDGEDPNISPISQDMDIPGRNSEGPVPSSGVSGRGESPGKSKGKRKSKKLKKKSSVLETSLPEGSLETQTEDFNSVWFGFDKGSVSRLRGLELTSPGREKAKEKPTEEVGGGINEADDSGGGISPMRHSSSTEHSGPAEHSGAMRGHLGGLDNLSDLSSEFLEPAAKRKHSRKDKDPPHGGASSEGVTGTSSPFVIPSPAELARLAKKSGKKKKRKRKTSGASDKTNDSGIHMSRDVGSVSTIAQDW